MSSRFIKLTSLITTAALLCSCASTTLIKSTPPGAELYIEGEKVGKTPYSHTDTRIVGSVIHTKMKKAGYEDLDIAITKSEEADVGAIIGGAIALVPLLWCMKYKPEHNYEMVSLATESEAPSYEQEPLPPPTKSIRSKKRSKR